MLSIRSKGAWLNGKPNLLYFVTFPYSYDIRRFFLCCIGWVIGQTSPLFHIVSIIIRNYSLRIQKSHLEKACHEKKYKLLDSNKLM